MEAAAILNSIRMAARRLVGKGVLRPPGFDLEQRKRGAPAIVNGRGMSAGRR
jgi:hypothetical protein